MSASTDQEAVSQAHRMYREGRFAQALQLNIQALEEAKQRQDLPAQLEELRNVGLCTYRLHRYDESVSALQKARELAQRLGDKLKELLICNHLAATLREKGELLQAYQLFERALVESEAPPYRAARMRLLGNFGALLDELGQRHRADELYARYEELTTIEGDRNRQANARGLVARTAESRKDWVLAQRKYAEEAELASQSGNVLRVLAAELHQARITARLGQATKARHLFAEVLRHCREVGHPRRLMDALERFAMFLRGQRELPQAYALLTEALALCGEEARHPEKRANILAGLAALCEDAGLHGEALEYLRESVEVRYKLYEPLRREAGIRELAQKRLDELAQKADVLLDEACKVVRTEEEQGQVLTLHNRLRGQEMSWPQLLAERDTRRRAAEHLWVWAERLRRESLQRWQKRLLPGCFERLSEQTQHELVKADVSYSSAVDDLSRSVQVLAAAIERELRLRVVEPYRPNERLTLGQLVALLKDVLEDRRTGKHQELRDELVRRRDSLQPFAPIVHALLKPLRLMRGALPLDSEGRPHTLVSLRNAVAHGSEQHRGLRIDRLVVDAVRRLLVLEDPPVLRLLAELNPLPV
ncbi:MAG: tetratricopeptide repeat protein [Polyangia bacterium]